MFRKYFLTLMLASLMLSANAQQNQEPVKKNTVFLELAGNGLFYSLNYDRILINKTRWQLAGRVGFMFYKSRLNYLENNNEIMISAPLEVSYLRGKGNHKLELGLGITPLYQNYQDFDASVINSLALVPVGRIGYRYQKKDGGIFYKAGFTPIFDFTSAKNIINHRTISPWLGLAIGYTLKN